MIGARLARVGCALAAVLGAVLPARPSEPGGLPGSAAYPRRSLPAALAQALPPEANAESDGVYQVRRFQGVGEALWVIAPPSRGAAAGRHLVFLQHGQTVREVGQAAGDLIDVDPESGLPRELYFHVAGAPKETRLRWAVDRYSAEAVGRRFRDPLAHERWSAAELREHALLDLQQGRFIASAGRYALLCEDPCPALDVEALAAADLQARLFPQALAALQRAIALPGHQAQDFQSLASLYRAQGRNAEAAEAEARFASERRTPAAADGGATGGAAGPSADGGPLGFTGRGSATGGTLGGALSTPR